MNVQDVDWQTRHEQMLEGLFDRTGMWLTREEYFAVVDFLDGYDSCCGHLDLNNGFREWLVEKIGHGPNSTAWPWLPLRLFPGYDAEKDRGSKVFPGREREFIEGLKQLLTEYLSDVRASTFPSGEPTVLDLIPYRARRNCGSDEDRAAWDAAAMSLRVSTSWLRVSLPGGMSSAPIHSVALWRESGALKLAVGGGYEEVHILSAESRQPEAVCVGDPSFATAVPAESDDARPIPGWLHRQPWSSHLGVAFREGRRVMVSAGCDGSVRLWDVESGSLVQELGNHGVPISAMETVMVDGRWLAVTGDRHGGVRVWDVESGDLQCSWMAGGDLMSVTSVTMCMDQAVATGGSDGVVRFWSPSEGTQRAQIDPHVGEAGSMLGWTDSGGSRLVIGGPEGTAVWDMESMSQMARYEFSGDARRVPYLALCTVAGRTLVAMVANAPSIRLWAWEASDVTGAIHLRIDRPRSMVGLGDVLAVGAGRGVTVVRLESAENGVAQSE